MKLAFYVSQGFGLMLIGMGGYHLFKARQIEGMGALGAGFLGAAEFGLGALLIIISVIVYWISKRRKNRT
ncbi:hypothetical protein [Paenibacillus sp. 7541]|uniref:hypothetical protein n=1 Tax=Paenibacillus sp. 7541 TaxID=2026236 RepID=UPI000BA52E45|nr:hypothetical protein [Paenibacillus sp. 7541]PAK55799.1 hypothetical protein CHH75_00580 [Paenibacillus sp. 7541]